MKRKNSKKGDNGFIFPPPVVAVVVVASIACLGYLSLMGRCETLGKEIKKLEADIAAKQKIHRSEQEKWSRLKAPGNIERALREFNITMDWPRGDQIVRLRPATSAVGLEATPPEPYHVAAVGRVRDNERRQ